jgi:hypothetical protein
MAITITKYVDIVSGVAAGYAIKSRELIGRLFTTNPLVPTDTVIEFTSAEEVGDWFGYTSEEYKRAAFYFGWISKNITKARKISFYRRADEGAEASIYGGSGAQVLADWQDITNGSFTIRTGTISVPVDAEFTGVDFSAAVSLSGVASILQTEIRAFDAADFWALSTVVWDSTGKRFVWTAGDTTDSIVEVIPGAVGTNIVTMMRWSLSSAAQWSNGLAPQSVTEMLYKSADVSNNFGSFCFMQDITVAQAIEAAEWTQGQNIRYIFSLSSNVDGSDNPMCDYVNAGIGAYGGVALSLNANSNEYISLFPMMILAATDYSRRASVQNYMFQVDDRLTPTVLTTAYSDSADAARFNYYGQTQQAGQKINFYQRGVLCGMPASPRDMNIFANEMWLKDAATVAIMELFMNLARISANSAGRSKIFTALQDVIDRALFNGTISVGKPLDSVQKQYITEQTGDQLAWYAVQNIGYWLDVVIVKVGLDYKAVYTLIYSKDDIIRKVDGSHQLI